MARARSTAFSTLQLAPYLLRMTVFLGLAGVAVAFILPQLFHAFMSNPFLNGLILAVLLLGLLPLFFCFGYCLGYLAFLHLSIYPFLVCLHFFRRCCA